MSSQCMSTMMVLFFFVLGTYCSMILVGGKQKCDLEKEDPSLDLAVEKIASCFGEQVDLPEHCPQFDEKDNVTMI